MAVGGIWRERSPGGYWRMIFRWFEGCYALFELGISDWRYQCYRTGRGGGGGFKDGTCPQFR